MRNKLWTNEEDKVIISQVKMYPENLRRAFIESSEKLKRTEAACANRWYAHISKQPNRENTCFVSISRKSYGRNRKNMCTVIDKKQSFWTKVISLLFNKNKW
jgi:hypothetical protein